MARKPTGEQAQVVNNLRLGRLPENSGHGSPWGYRGEVIHFEHGPEAAGTWSVAVTHAGSALTQLWRIEKDGRAYQV